MLQGKSLYLKGLERDDLADRHTWLNDKEVTYYFTNLGSLPLSYQKLLQWFEKISGSNQEIHFSVFLNDHTHIGGAQIKSIDWKNRSAEFGLFIGDKSQWGKGYCSQITQLLLDYSFQELNLHRIWLRVDQDNQAAIQCYKKVGFIEEGIFREEVYRSGAYRDTLVMSILQNEYLSTLPQ